MAKNLSDILKGGTLPVLHGGTGVTVSTGTGSVVLNTSPSLVTPDIGIATATSVNKIAFTQPANGATFTISDGKTLTVNNSITFTGTDNSILTCGSGGTVAYTNVHKLSDFQATTSTELASVISDETGYATNAKLMFNISPEVNTSITTASTSFDLINTTAETVNFAKAATTLSIGASTGTTTVNNDLQVTGNFYFNGTASQLSASTIEVQDTLVMLGKNNPADVIDVGVYGSYISAGTGIRSYTGLIRDVSDSKTWKLFSELTSAPTTTADFSSAQYDSLIIAGLTATSGTFSSQITSTVAQGTAPFVVTSTTPVTNLSIGGNAATVTTNANMTGPITGTGNVTSITSQTGTGTKFVMDTSPTLISPTLGDATATSINKITITQPATSATLTIVNGKVLTISNTLTFSGTDSSSVNFTDGGTVAYTDKTKLSNFQNTTSLELFGIMTDPTGTAGKLVFSDTPTLTTPEIGEATGTSVVLTSDSTIHGLTIGTGASNITSNTAYGVTTLAAVTSGVNNTAIGNKSINALTIGGFNTAVGSESLLLTIDGSNNVAIGFSSLKSNTTGAQNVAIGSNAGYGTGANANTIGTDNVYIGYKSVGSANNNVNEIVIGSNAVGLGSNSTVLGNNDTTATTIYGSLSIPDTTSSTDSVTGALKVAGGVGIGGNVNIDGNLTVNGLTTTINSTTITVDDKNIELGSTANPTDTAADGGGITLKGTTDKSFTWDQATNSWTSNVGITASSIQNTPIGSDTASTGNFTDLTIEDNGAFILKESSVNGINYISIKSPSNLADNYTLTLPTTHGSIGQVLTTDGNGNLSFTDSDSFGGNIVYVSASKGDDNNDGIGAPVKTIKRGLQIASGMVYNSLGAVTGTRVVVSVAAGNYVENNPVIVPDNVSVEGAGLRACVIRPLNANKDMFRLRNGGYFAQFTFRDGVTTAGVPSYTWAYAIAFDDVFDTQCDRTGYVNLPSTKPTMTLSPYIQNCSIISFLGGSGAYVDGSKIANPNVPASLLEVEVNPAGAAPVQCKSMIANAFTMISFGGTGWRVTNDAYVQLVSCFQLFLLNGVYAQSGGYTSITNSATNFGKYALRSSGFSPIAYPYDRAVVAAVGASGSTQNITAIGFTRPDGPVEQYVLRIYDNNAFDYNVEICQRDIGFIIDAIGYDMMFGGNFRSITAAKTYYSAQASTVIGLQKSATIAAFTFLRDYIANAVNGDPAAGTSVMNNMNSINSIVNSGISAIPAVVLPQPTNIDAGFASAATLIYGNKEFLQHEVVAYLNTNYYSVWSGLTAEQQQQCTRDMGYVIDAIRYDLTYGGNLETAVCARLMKNQLTNELVEPSIQQAAVTAVYARLKAIIGNILTNSTSWTRSTFTYDVAVCQRDTGFIIDAVRYDMMFGGNFRSITAARTYYSAQSSTVLSAQKAATISAFSYLKSNLLTAVSGDTTATASVTSNMNLILNVISSGLSAVPAITVPEPTNIAQGFSDGARLLYANKTFIQAESVAYLNTNQNALWTSLTPTQQSQCTRDMGYIVEAIRYDLTYGGNLETGVTCRLMKNQLTSVLVEPAAQRTATIALYDWLISTVLRKIITNETTWTKSTGNTETQVVFGTAGSAAAATFAEARLTEIRTVMNGGATPAEITPSSTWVANSTLITYSDTLNTNKTTIATDLTTYISTQYGIGVSQYISGVPATTPAINFAIARLEEMRIMVSTATEPSVIYPDTTWVENANLITQFNILQTNKDAIKTFVTDYISTQFGATDLTSTYKMQSPNYLQVAINALTGVDLTSNVFTILNHGLVNGDSVVYDSTGHSPIGGMFSGSVYYVYYLNASEFKLTHDDSLTLFVDATMLSTGLHTFTKNEYELYVDYVSSSHTTFQTLVLATAYAFESGDLLEGTTLGLANNASVYSYDGDKTIVVAVNLVTINMAQERKLFAAGSTITKVNSTIISITVNTATLRNDLHAATFNISPTIIGGALDNIASLVGKQIYFHRASIVNSSSHTWEYAGSGIDYNALPNNGGKTDTTYEQFQENAGRVYTSGTNELGDFKVGDFIVAYNRTGNIEFKNTVTVSQLNVLKLALSDISVDAISNDIGLGENEVGGPTDNKLSTQLAVWSYANTRLGSFIDKSVSTNAVPGAIVQLNATGQINVDLIPAQRTTASIITYGYRSRLTAYEDVPSVNFLSGDNSTEQFQTVTLTLDSPITALDGVVVSQTASGASGLLKGDHTDATTILVASSNGSFTTLFDTNATHTLTINSDTSPSTTNTTVYCTAVSSPIDASDNNVLRNSTTNQYLILPSSLSYTYTFTNISKVLRYNNIAYVITSSSHQLATNNQVKVTANTLTTYTAISPVTVFDSTSFSYSNTGVQTTPSASTTATATINAGTGSCTGSVASASLTGTILYGDYVFGGGLPLGSIVTAVDMGVSPRTFTITFPFSLDTSSASTTATLTFISPITTAGTVRSVITAVNNNAQGEVSELRTGMLTSVNNLAITGGSNYVNGTYLRVSLSNVTGSGSGALANITVTSGSITTVDVVYAGTGYAVGNVVSASLPGGSGFSISVLSVETRAYVNNISDLFLGSVISPDFTSDNVSVVKTITSSSTITKTFNAVSDVNYATNRITIATHGFSNGDSVMYNQGSNVAISGLSSVLPYYVKTIDANTIELYGEYYLTNIISFGTSSTGTHSLTINAINLINNRLYVAAHGLSTGDSITMTGSNLPSIDSNQIANGSNFFVGSVTTNTFTIHNLRSDALDSVNGAIIAVNNITSIGSGTVSIIHNQVQIIGYSNTSSKIISNWGLLASSSIDASNIVSGIVATSRLAGSGTASSTTFLRGDSTWSPAVTSIQATNSALTITGSGVGAMYGALTFDVAKATFPTDNGSYSTLGVASFNVDQFNVGTGITAGQVYIKQGVVDAGTLDGHDSNFFQDPANLTSSIPLSKGGTGISTYTAGDMIYASTSSSLNQLAIGPANTILSSNGTLPVWSPAISLATVINTGAGEIATTNAGTANVFNTSALTLNIGGAATSVYVGVSSTNISLANVKNYTTNGVASTTVSASFGISVDISTTARNGSNVSTIVTTANHGLTNGDLVTVICLSNNSYNVRNAPVTVTSTTSFTYPNVGSLTTVVSSTGTVYTGAFSASLSTSVVNGDTTLSFGSTIGVVIGQTVQGSPHIPTNTIVIGKDATNVYLSAAVTDIIVSTSTIVFTHTNASLGINTGNQITITSSGITNLNGTWPVTSATATATSFSIVITNSITASSEPRVGTITKANSLVLRNKTIAFGSSEASATPVAATLVGENGVGINVAGADFNIIPGAATGNAASGKFVVKTSDSGTSGSAPQLTSTKLSIDGSGLATFTNSVIIENNLEVHGVVTNGITNASATAVKSFSAVTYRSAKMIFQVTCTSGPNVNTYQIGEVLVIHDGTTAYMAEYGDIKTGANLLATFTCDIDGMNNVRILAQALTGDTISVRVVSSLNII